MKTLTLPSLFICTDAAAPASAVDADAHAASALSKTLSPVTGGVDHALSHAHSVSSGTARLPLELNLPRVSLPLSTTVTFLMLISLPFAPTKPTNARSVRGSAALLGSPP